MSTSPQDNTLRGPPFVVSTSQDLVAKDLKSEIT